MSYRGGTGSAVRTAKRHNRYIKRTVHRRLKPFLAMNVNRMCEGRKIGSLDPRYLAVEYGTGHNLIRNGSFEHDDIFRAFPDDWDFKSSGSAMLITQLTKEAANTIVNGISQGATTVSLASVANLQPGDPLLLNGVHQYQGGGGGGPGPHPEFAQAVQGAYHKHREFAWIDYSWNGQASAVVLAEPLKHYHPENTYVHKLIACIDDRAAINNQQTLEGPFNGTKALRLDVPVSASDPVQSMVESSASTNYWGVQTNTDMAAASDITLTNLLAFESQASKTMSLVQFNRGWGPNASQSHWDINLFNAIKTHNSAPFVTWNPMDTDFSPGASQQLPYVLNNIIRGDFDDFINATASVCVAFNSDVYIRIMQDFNASSFVNWSPGQTDVAGSQVTVNDFVAAWKHIWSIFQENNCYKVHWVWCPYTWDATHNYSGGSNITFNNNMWNASAYTAPWNPILSDCYPGTEFVDDFGLDGYNQGGPDTGHPSSSFWAFEDLFLPALWELKNFDRKNVIVAEFGTDNTNLFSSAPYNKATWFSHAASTLAHYSVAGSGVLGGVVFGGGGGSSAVQLGVMTKDGLSPTGITEISTFETDAGRHADLVNGGVSGWTATDSQINAAHSRGSIPIVTCDPPVSLTTILSGTQDTAITALANDLKALGYPIWFRFAHEMNGNWYAWGQQPNFIAAWQYVHAKFVAAGASNCLWVFNPNIQPPHATTQQQIATYWPGASCVDIIALDGYNKPTTYGEWLWWADLFNLGNSYAAITSLSASMPLIINETGCAEISDFISAGKPYPAGATKADWYTNAYQVGIPSMPRITGVVWFNVNQDALGGDGSGNFPIESDSDAQAAFNAMVNTGGSYSYSGASSYSYGACNLTYGFIAGCYNNAGHWAIDSEDGTGAGFKSAVAANVSYNFTPLILNTADYVEALSNWFVVRPGEIYYAAVAAISSPGAVANDAGLTFDIEFEGEYKSKSKPGKRKTIRHKEHLIPVDSKVDNLNWEVFEVNFQSPVTPETLTVDNPKKRIWHLDATKARVIIRNNKQYGVPLWVDDCRVIDLSEHKWHHDFYNPGAPEIQNPAYVQKKHDSWMVPASQYPENSGNVDCMVYVEDNPRAVSTRFEFEAHVGLTTASSSAGIVYANNPTGDDLHVLTVQPTEFYMLRINGPNAVAPINTHGETKAGCDFIHVYYDNNQGWVYQYLGTTGKLPKYLNSPYYTRHHGIKIIHDPFNTKYGANGSIEAYFMHRKIFEGECAFAEGIAGIFGGDTGSRKIGGVHVAAQMKDVVRRSGQQDHLHVHGGGGGVHRPQTDAVSGNSQSVLVVDGNGTQAVPQAAPGHVYYADQVGDKLYFGKTDNMWHEFSFGGGGGSGLGGGYPTITVAAANSSDKDKALADFVCTGTNDEITINEAIAALPTSDVFAINDFISSHPYPVGRISLLEGTYLPSSPLTPLTGMVSLCGLNWGTMIDVSGFSGSEPFIQMSSDGGSGGFATLINDLTICGINNAASVATAPIIYLNISSDCKINNCWFYGFKPGVTDNIGPLRTTASSIVTMPCVIETFEDYSTEISSNYFNELIVTAISASETFDGVNITGNRFDNVLAYPGPAVVQLLTSDSIYVNFSGNHFIECGGGASGIDLLLQDVFESNIINNTFFRSNKNGIVIQDYDSFQLNISHNQLFTSSGGSVGIWCQNGRPFENLFMSNVIEGYAYGIKVDGTSGGQSQLYDNQIVRCIYGIFITGSFNDSILGNSISYGSVGGSGNGIYVDTCTNELINNNNITTNQSFVDFTVGYENPEPAIALIDSSKSCINDNYIFTISSTGGSAYPNASIGPSSPIAFLLDGASSNFLQGNFVVNDNFTPVSVGASIVGVSVNNKVVLADNDFRQCSPQIVDTGTGTITRDGYIPTGPPMVAAGASSQVLSASLIYGDDEKGVIAFTTASAPTASNILFTVTLNTARGSKFCVIIQPNTGVVADAVALYAVPDAGGTKFDAYGLVNLLANTVYSASYIAPT